MQAIPATTCPRRPSLYDQRVENAAQAVRDAIATVTAMKDRQARAKAATDVLELLSEANGVLAKLRREDIAALREAGMSYRQIGTALGVHHTRVKQIESGAPMGNSARGRAAKASPD
jgi:DNA-directed RNA polymerase sigma subunit (sigma70/sigma32)